MASCWMVGFSKPDTIYLLCNLVVLSLSKLHFLEKQRLGACGGVGGDHICPLAFSQETGQVFLAIISRGQEVEVPWKSFCWNPLPVITSPVSSLGSEAAVREELCPFCLGSLETVSCLLSESIPSCCMRKDGGTSQPLMGFSSLCLKTTDKVVLLPTYSSAREALPAGKHASWSLSLLSTLSLSSSLLPPSLSLTSNFLSLENEAMNHMSSLGFHFPAQSTEEPLFRLHYSQLSIIQVWTFPSVGGLWMVSNTRPPFISQHTFLQVLIAVCSEPRIEFGRKSCCQSTVHSRALHELFCIIHIMECCPPALSWRP